MLHYVTHVAIGISNRKLYQADYTYVMVVALKIDANWRQTFTWSNQCC